MNFKWTACLKCPSGPWASSCSPTARADSDYLGASSHATSRFLRAGIATLRFDQGSVEPGGGSNGHAYFVRSDIVLLAPSWKALGRSTRPRGACLAACITAPARPS
jgi:hypothetical protein